MLSSEEAAPFFIILMTIADNLQTKTLKVKT